MLKKVKSFLVPPEMVLVAVRKDASAKTGVLGDCSYFVSSFNAQGESRVSDPVRILIEIGEIAELCWPRMVRVKGYRVYRSSSRNKKTARLIGTIAQPVKGAVRFDDYLEAPDLTRTTVIQD